MQETCRKFIPQALYHICFLGNGGYVYENTADFTRGFSCSTSNITGYLRQEDDEYAGWEALIVHFLGGGSNHVTLLSYGTNQESIRFHSYNLFIFSFPYFRTLGTMFNLSVRGVKMGRLMIP